MKSIEKNIRKRFLQRLPSNVRNPRKLKKAWKGCLIARTRAKISHNRWRLHWVPKQGWTLTAKRNLATKVRSNSA